MRYILLIVIFSFNSSSVLWAGEKTIFSADSIPSSVFLAKGKNLFLKYCAHCHGNQGDGDGFNAEFLDKDPAELSDPKFQAKRSNEKLFHVISEGGAKVKKSHLMPAFGFTLSEEEIWTLVAFIRYLGKEDPLLNIPSDIKSERPTMPIVTKSDINSFLKWLSKEGLKKNQIDSGKSLVMNKTSCLGCHQLNDEGGRIGPSLNYSSFHYKPEWIYAWIYNPQGFRPETKMPNLGLKPKEARAIAAFLASFQPEEEGKEIEFTIPNDWKQYLFTEGDRKRGKKIFNDSEGTANCSKCHLVGSNGGAVGPDLSFVGTSRTREFILESILDPSKVITSGYETLMILTKNRKFITGIKKNEDESGFYLIDKGGKELHVPMEKIKKFKTQKISTMPGNFKDLLKVQEIVDLLAYLTSLTLPSIKTPLR